MAALLEGVSGKAKFSLNLASTDLSLNGGVTARFMDHLPSRTRLACFFGTGSWNADFAARRMLRLGSQSSLTLEVLARGGVTRIGPSSGRQRESAKEAAGVGEGCPAAARVGELRSAATVTSVGRLLGRSDVVSSICAISAHQSTRSPGGWLLEVGVGARSSMPSSESTQSAHQSKWASGGPGQRGHHAGASERWPGSGPRSQSEGSQLLADPATTEWAVVQSWSGPCCQRTATLQGKAGPGIRLCAPQETGSHAWACSPDAATRHPRPM